MHARLNYVDMDPERFDEVDPFWRGVVEGYEDLVCGYFLREGESPHTLSVVLFRSEAAMRANTERSLGDVVKRAAALRLGEPVLHPLEVCAQVPPEGSAAPACARVAKAGLVPERAEEFIAGWPGGMAPYRKGSGFHSAILCCDRRTGELRSITFWDSRAALDANERSGVFASAVAPYREMMRAPPELSYWDVRIMVRPGDGPGGAG